MRDAGWQIRDTGLGIEVPLHVLPRAKRSEIAGLHNGALKLRVAAPPVDDAANRAVVQFFSSLLDIPKSRLRITAGSKSRRKILQIDGVSPGELLSHFRDLPNRNGIAKLRANWIYRE